MFFTYYFISYDYLNLDFRLYVPRLKYCNQKHCLNSTGTAKEQQDLYVQKSSSNYDNTQLNYF